MEAIFVDTSAWDVIEDSGDRYHAAALRFKEDLVQQQTRLYVTNFILDEAIPCCSTISAIRVQWHSNAQLI